MRSERKIKLPSQDEAVRLCGTYDRYLKEISCAFNVKVSLRGNTLRIKGDRASVTKAYNVFQRISERLKEVSSISMEELASIIHKKPRTADDDEDMLKPEVRLTQLKARTEGQARYIKTMETHDIVFSIGPAGTGKTYLAVARALQCLRVNRVEKIVLARPAVEAGERLGFLPGDYQDKVNPYLRPLYDALNHFLPHQQLKRLMDSEIVEVVPIAYMRGRNLDNAFMILDEGQNTTSEQMKMFLTRMGEGSKIVVTGDITQIDLPMGKISGLVESQSVLADIKGIAFCYLTRADIVRHPLVQSVVDAYDMKRNSGKKHPRRQ